mmetsp:Transcript_118746/g.331286  ORF Transcript_118746/g.331286 Transcript_118746/m.331286 type:complete len:227 (-) Transcript_118746:125-805(-)
MLCKVMALASFAFATAEEAAPSAEGLLVDDECLGSDTQCSLNALQLRGVPMLSSSTAEGQNASKSITMLESGQGWYKGGDKVWGNGRGIEVITSKNVGYYDGGMDYARAQCSDPGCALIINPPGHRTVQRIHIHTVHYHGYGKSLKARLESKVCGKAGWHGGGLPCGGRAAYIHGWPKVFSAAMGGGDIHHASVVAWPGSCGGSGTIVELAFHCSIEHQIRGDYRR